MTRHPLFCRATLALAVVAVVVAVSFPIESCRAQQELIYRPVIGFGTIASTNKDASNPGRVKIDVGVDGNFSLPVIVTQSGAPAAPSGYTYTRTSLSIDRNQTEILAPAVTSGNEIGLKISDRLTNRPVAIEAVATFKLTKDDNTEMSAEVFDGYRQRITLRSERLVFFNDLTGPQLAGPPTAEPAPGGGGTVYLVFKEGDVLTSTITKAAFGFRRIIANAFAPGSEDATTFTVSASTYDPNTRRLAIEFTKLDPGLYELTVKAGLTDRLNNPARLSPFEFEVAGDRLRGRQVEYPRNLAPENNQSTLIDPGNRVDTRDVRLYYFRDAHRVAELINRNVRSLNKTGYDAAQRIAARAREESEKRIDERRYTEVLAVQAAQTARATRTARDAAIKKSDANIEKVDDLEARQLQLTEDIGKIRLGDGFPEASIPGKAAADYTSRIEALRLEQRRKPGTETIDPGEPVKAAGYDLIRPGAIQTASLRSMQDSGTTGPESEMLSDLPTLETHRKWILELDAARVREKRALDRANGQLKNSDSEIDRLETKLVHDERTEIDVRNDVVRAESAELRGAQNQFRREVAAGLSDRDTYVPGDPRSVDPVTQVSISVIGEGVLQLRGPMNGINKVRRMVHQIDSPVGQVKVGIHTIQINGEHGDRMERVYEEIDKHVAHSRFLTNQSLLMFRKAVATVASRRAAEIEAGGFTAGFDQASYHQSNDPNGNSLKYLYGFFGHDFIEELVEMDSELLHSDNKLLSLNSMNTLSLAGALNVAALANNEARQEIVSEFQNLIHCDLAQKEVDYYRSLTRTRHRHNFLNKLTGPKTQTRLDARDEEKLRFNAQRTYCFSNLIGFFDSRITGAGTLNNMQFATLRLAQTLKAQLIAERELKNLVKERSLLEVDRGEIETDYRAKAVEARSLLAISEAEKARAAAAASEWFREFGGNVTAYNRTFVNKQRLSGKLADAMRLERELTVFRGLLDTVQQRVKNGQLAPDKLVSSGRSLLAQTPRGYVQQILFAANPEIKWRAGENEYFGVLVQDVRLSVEDVDRLKSLIGEWEARNRSYQYADAKYLKMKELAEPAKNLLFSKRMLEQFIDEQEEKSVELLEALRSNSSNVDNYLKRLAIALEDDLEAQFYAPAFQKIRRVSRTYDVQLGQIEKTTVLTNNRTLGKVSPSATMEFDLPHRDILIKEAMEGSKALATEYGNLLQDGTFLAGTSLLAGQPAGGLVNSRTPMQDIPGLRDRRLDGEFGASLEALIPEPSVYKFETGTGFEIRPVIQPDGHSIVYDFDYMYTTNVREPVRADEKHLGRVKRHFVHTDVQTSSYELREISRYTVALKAARTSRGVPLLEDVPIAGVLFRPVASAESSLQENIILGSSVIYPTLYDLMGLRWSPYVDDIRSGTLVTEKGNQQMRENELRQHLRQRTRSIVNDQLGIPNPRMVSPEAITPGPVFDATTPELIPPGVPRHGATRTQSPYPAGERIDSRPPASPGFGYQHRPRTLGAPAGRARLGPQTPPQPPSQASHYGNAPAVTPRVNSRVKRWWNSKIVPVSAVDR